MEFVQVIEFSTSRGDELQKLAADFQAGMEGREGGPRSVTVTADRDRPNQYVTIVRFDSYDEAMENSKSPEVSAFAQAMAELCDGPPTFRNLDVVDRRER
jgi:quinol monooxygenase YgiN